MRLLIANSDYTAALAADALPRITRQLNRPSELFCGLIAASDGFVVPEPGARLHLLREDDTALFTGFLDVAPEHEYLGWTGPGPAYRYLLHAVSDEWLLDRARVADRPTFINRTAGHILRAIASGLDTSAASDLDPVSPYWADPRLRWSEHAAALSQRARACYRVLDGRLTFAPVGEVTHLLDESEPNFSPESLRITAPDRLINDLTVTGQIEPGAHVRDYFLGDGLTLGFQLSQSVFGNSTRVIVDEEFRGIALDPLRWTSDGAISVSGGALHLDGEAVVEFTESLEAGGSLLLQHGEFTFDAATDATLGGLYFDGACVFGFRATPVGNTRLQAIYNGQPTGATIATVAGRRYGLTTRIYAPEHYRAGQRFHSCAHPAGNARGGAVVPTTARVILEVHAIDPATPGSEANVSTILFDSEVSLQAFYPYILASASDAHCSCRFTRLTRSPALEVRTALPGQGFRSRLLGHLADGGECTLLPGDEVRFHGAYVLASDEKLVVRYRDRADSFARLRDDTSIAAHGLRADAWHIVVPSARTSAECDNAARALLDDSTQPAASGTYVAHSDLIADIHPGDAVHVLAPSRAADLTAVVRRVDIASVDLASDLARYEFTFANDAAESLAAILEPAGTQLADESLDVSETATYPDDIPNAAITAVESTFVTVDCGAAQPSGGGIEVRRGDYGWAAENDRNLVGRFTAQSFNLTRLSAHETYCLRPYDASSRYSRHSTILHLDYPY